MEEYFYSYITRPADELLVLCGKNILECDAAFECTADSPECEMIFCDPVTEAGSCSTL